MVNATILRLEGQMDEVCIEPQSTGPLVGAGTIVRAALWELCHQGRSWNAWRCIAFWRPCSEQRKVTYIGFSFLSPSNHLPDISLAKGSLETEFEQGGLQELALCDIKWIRGRTEMNVRRKRQMADTTSLTILVKRFEHLNLSFFSNAGVMQSNS